MRLLEHAPRTRGELAVAIARRGVPAEAAEVVLDRFTEAGLIDDASFAQAWVDSRHHSRGLSRRVLSTELHRKGVDDEIVAEALSSVTQEDEVIAAQALVQRKLRSMTGLPRDVATRRLIGMLGRKGFTGGLAYRVVAEALGDAAAVSQS